jgi:hypothetical protein
MFGAGGCQKLIKSESVVLAHILSFFLASSEASELLRAANATSTPSIGDISGVVLLGVVFFGGDFTGVAAAWLIVTPFLTVLMFCGTNFLFEAPHR